jgi:ATP/maltotriose-dependent transcriptional regulator MalT
MTLSMAGEVAVGGGWAARANRLLEDDDEDLVERGYLRILDMFRHIFSGEFATAMELAVEVETYGRRFDDPDLVAMGLVAQGRMLLYDGRVPEGLARLDEAMAELTTGRVSTVFAGNVYCTMIEGCQEVSDLGRAAEWTAALGAWCDAQPGLVAYTGQCAVHRGQIMRLHGAYDEALVEFERAVERYIESGVEVAAGLTFAERGDVLRIQGELDAADAAFQQAADRGHDPQPGLAQLWLARGRFDAAASAARRLGAEARDPVHRSRLLPAAVEIFLAADATDEAEAASTELTDIAASFGCTALRAMACYAAGSVALRRDDAAGSVRELRRAVEVWSELQAPYERARCRVRLGQALRRLGDERSAVAELAAARRDFAALGARPAEGEVARLLTPAAPGGLSRRETEVLRLVAAGKTNQQIAAALVLSEKTVARHLSNIFGKLDVTSRTAAAAYAYEHGLV